MGRKLSFFVLFVFMSGCAIFRDSSKQPPVMTPELRAALKVAYAGEIPDYAMTANVDMVRSLDGKLREVGAKFASDGKLYDRKGKEIYLWSEHAGNAKAAYLSNQYEQWQQQSQQALEEAKRRYTVIEVGYWGPQPP